MGRANVGVITKGKSDVMNVAYRLKLLIYLPELRSKDRGTEEVWDVL